MRRDSINYLDEAILNGYISKKPHFNSLCNYLRKDWMTDVLSELLTISSLPLAAIETSFSVDSTGFGINEKKRWFDVKYGNVEDWRGWTKAHVICGNTTKIIISAIITPAYKHDSPFFIPLVEKAAKFFRLEEVMADAAYSSKQNLEFVNAQNAQPFIAFKNNAVFGTESDVWNKILHFYSFHHDEFHERYRHRSNVETAFSAIKENFGERLRSRDERGQANELIIKLICHNLCVLVRSMFELKINIDLWKRQADGIDSSLALPLLSRETAGNGSINLET